MLCYGREREREREREIGREQLRMRAHPCGGERCSSRPSCCADAGQHVWVWHLDLVCVWIDRGLPCKVQIRWLPSSIEKTV